MHLAEAVLIGLGIGAIAWLIGHVNAPREPSESAREMVLTMVFGLLGGLTPYVVGTVMGWLAPYDDGLALATSASGAVFAVTVYAAARGDTTLRDKGEHRGHAKAD
jgi:hypothetical protein